MYCGCRLKKALKARLDVPLLGMDTVALHGHVSSVSVPWAA